MLRPVAGASERWLKKCGGRNVESGRVGASVSEERIAVLEESLRSFLGAAYEGDEELHNG